MNYYTQIASSLFLVITAPVQLNASLARPCPLAPRADAAHESIALEHVVSRVQPEDSGFTPLASAEADTSRGGSADEARRGGEPAPLSPFTPPPVSDFTFVSGNGPDDGPGYDVIHGRGAFSVDFKIPLVPGNVSKLLQGPNPSMNYYAKITAPVWDVDFSGSVIYDKVGERDRLYVNSVPIEGTQQFFDGRNDEWVLNVFYVPVNILRFPTIPSDPNGVLQPEVNALTIEVDLLDEGWVTAIDWIAVEIQTAPPIVFVHGYTDGAWTFQNACTDTGLCDGYWVSQAFNKGLLYRVVPDMGNAGLADHAAKILAQVDYIRNRTGWSKVTLVTFSKGGVDARYFSLLHDRVYSIFQIAPPNGGSPLALGGVVAVATNDSVGLGDYFDYVKRFRGSGFQEITPSRMEAFNALPRKYQALVFSLSGTIADPLPLPLLECESPYDSLAWQMEGGRYAIREYYRRLRGIFATDDDVHSDGAVPVSSVHALPYSFPIRLVGSGCPIPYSHPNLVRLVGHNTSKPTAFDSIWPLATRPRNDKIGSQPFGAPGAASSSSAAIDPSTVASLSRRDQSSEPALLTETTKFATALLDDGQVADLTIPIEHSGSTTFSVLFPSGDISVELISPSGVRISPASAELDPSIAYVEGSLALPALPTKSYQFSGTELGLWTVEVRATRIDEPLGRMSVLAYAELNAASLILQPDSIESSVALTSPFLVRASLFDSGAPVTGATMLATLCKPDGTFDVLPMLDDGIEPDEAEHDGFYSARTHNLSVYGNYQLLFAASGTLPNGRQYSRSGLVELPVSESASYIEPALAERVEAVGFGSLYDFLYIDGTLSVNVTSSVQVVGELIDSENHVLTATTGELTLVPGRHDFSLRFSGPELFANGTSGPYTLRSLRLLETQPSGSDGSVLVVPLQTLSNCYVTASYSFEEFDREIIRFGRVLSSAGRDTNGNGYFDYLDVDIEVGLTYGNDYTASAQLMTSDGLNRLGSFAQRTGHIGPGLSSVRLTFDGKAIRSLGVDGPYAVEGFALNGHIFGAAYSREPFLTADFSATQFEPCAFSPQITAPPGLVLTESGSCSASATYAPFAVDGCTHRPILVDVMCSPPSGTVLPVGVHTVTASMVYAGSTITKDFQVTVRDPNPPALSVPTSLAADAPAGSCGVSLSYGITTADDCGTPTVQSDYPSGSFFPIGSTTVTVRSTDPGGNVTTKDFVVTIRDVTAPTVTCADVVATASTGQCSTAVVFSTPTVVDCSTYEVAFSPPSGSVLPVGSYVATCTVTDSWGNVTIRPFGVAVRESLAPVFFFVPTDIRLRAAVSVTTVPVSYPQPQAITGCGGAAPVECTPPSGSLFPYGTTTVQCVASGLAGDTSSASFKVTVISRGDTIGQGQTSALGFSNLTASNGPSDNPLDGINVAFATFPASAQTISGDWNGDGIDTLGYYVLITNAQGQSFARFLLRLDNRDNSPNSQFDVPIPTAVGIVVPVVGDWNGDGISTVGLFERSTGKWYLKNTNNAVAFSPGFVFGGADPSTGGDKPLAGDWNGDGIDSVGLYDASMQTFRLRNSNSAGLPDITLLIPIGETGGVAIAGDWDGNGVDTYGFTNATGGNVVKLRNTNTVGPWDLSYVGLNLGTVIVGNWDGDISPLISSIRPMAAKAGSNSMVVTLTGEHLENTSTIYLSPPNSSSISSLVASSSQVTFQISVPSGAPVEALNLYVTSSLGRSNHVRFTVRSAAGTNETDTVGIHDRSTGNWFLRDSNTSGDANQTFGFGAASSTTVEIRGDWNGDGLDTVGLYVPSSGTFLLRNSNAPGNADLVFTFGPGGLGWIPLVGDWNGDGVDTIGAYDPINGAFYLRDSNSNGAANLSFGFGAGNVGYRPVTGDWNSDGVDTIGLYQPSGGIVYLRDTNSSGGADVSFSFGPGISTWRVLAGDWNGDGADTIGLYDPSGGTFFLRNMNSNGAADRVVSFGPVSSSIEPIVGDWDALGF